MAIQAVRRSLVPLYRRQPVLSLLWRIPLQTIKKEIIEVSLGVVVFLFMMKMYYRMLRLLYPVLRIVNPSITRRWYLYLSFIFYEKIVPSPKTLFKTGLKLYKQI